MRTKIKSKSRRKMEKIQKSVSHQLSLNMSHCQIVSSESESFSLSRSVEHPVSRQNTTARRGRAAPPSPHHLSIHGHRRTAKARRSRTTGCICRAQCILHLGQHYLLCPSSGPGSQVPSGRATRGLPRLVLRRIARCLRSARTVGQAPEVAWRHGKVHRCGSKLRCPSSAVQTAFDTTG